MEKKDKVGKNVLEENLRHLCELEKQKLRLKKERAGAERLEMRERQKLYLKWKDSFQPRYGKSAKKICGWFRRFVKTNAFEQLKRLVELQSHQAVAISRSIKYERPSKWEKSEFESFAQSLAIDVKKKALYVYDNIKYGSSYRINSEKDVMTYVDPPVAIEIAKTIENNAIEETILNVLSLED